MTSQDLLMRISLGGVTGRRLYLRTFLRMIQKEDGQRGLKVINDLTQRWNEEDRDYIDFITNEVIEALLCNEEGVVQR